MDTLHKKMYRLFDGLPWMVLWIYAFLVEPNGWLAAIGAIGMSHRFFVGWEYPPPTMEELERRAKEREREKAARA